MNDIKKRDYRKHFDGSDALFDACWRKLLAWIREGGVIEPAEVPFFLDDEATRLVNNHRTRFWITG